MIKIDHLNKQYGSVTAVDGLSFEVGPGRVTGFLGPNGAGKTTTLRILLGLAEAGHRRVGGFSLGMRQRLTLAAALLGDPGVLLFDEPVNGLDPEGIRWVRHFLRGLAAEGRTVFVSSHLISEMSQTADRLIVIGRGRLIAETSVADFVTRSGHRAVRLITPDRARFTSALTANGGGLADGDGGSLTVEGLTAAQIGDLAASDGLRIHELTPIAASLEDAFMELTQDEVEYRPSTMAAAARVKD
jgi:ABC-2 type transport system ATP-binding protein